MNNNIGGDNITFKYKYRKQIIISILIVIIILSITIYLLLNYKPKKSDSIVKENKDILKKEPKKEISPELFKVDIKGEINNPGIYELAINSRIIDVINIAGGLTENADTSVINLSKKIADEMVIIVYSKEQVLDFSKTKEEEKKLQEKCIKQDETSITNDACITDNNTINKRININTASKEELMILQKIGESKAEEIIKYREKNGLFENIEDIKKVPGIGENLFASIKEDITT